MTPILYLHIGDSNKNHMCRSELFKKNVSINVDIYYQLTQLKKVAKIKFNLIFVPDMKAVRTILQ